MGLFGQSVRPYRIFCGWCGFSRRVVETSEQMWVLIDLPCICCGKDGLDAIEGRQ